MIKSWLSVVGIIPSVEEFLTGKAQCSLTVGWTDEGEEEGVNEAGEGEACAAGEHWAAGIGTPCAWAAVRVRVSRDLRWYLSPWCANDLSLWSFYLLPLDLFWVISEYFGTVFDNVCLNLRHFFTLFSILNILQLQRPGKSGTVHLSSVLRDMCGVDFRLWHTHHWVVKDQGFKMSLYCKL